MQKFLTILLLFCCTYLGAQESIFLRDNLKRAIKGDYIVTAHNKNFTLLHIYDKKDALITIEEITVPTQRMQGRFPSWKEWIRQRAPYNTSWIMYTVNLNTGQMQEYYSLTKNAWFDMSQADSFLSTLLNLRLELVPMKDRRRIGLPPIIGATDRRPYWQPRLVIDGQEVGGVIFDAWQTKWPKDNSELSGKSIEVYVPHENDKYPSYFPYWLQISGLISNAKVRIIDSGTGMVSPAPPLLSQRKNIN